MSYWFPIIHLTWHKTVSISPTASPNHSFVTKILYSNAGQQQPKTILLQMLARWCTVRHTGEKILKLKIMISERVVHTDLLYCIEELMGWVSWVCMHNIVNYLVHKHQYDLSCHLQIKKHVRYSMCVYVCACLVMRNL